MSTLTKNSNELLRGGGFEGKMFNKSVDLENSKKITIKRGKTTRNSIFKVITTIYLCRNQIGLNISQYFCIH